MRTSSTWATRPATPTVRGPLDEVAGFANQIAGHLVETHDVKALVVACNTAAAAALEDIADRVDVPVVGVIEPGVQALLDATVTGRVGVIGTVGTVDSGAYEQVFAMLAAGGAGSGDLYQGNPCGPDQIDEPHPPLELAVAACPGFVEFVERGDFDVPGGACARGTTCWRPIAEAKVDTLLLGCTHYPYLARTISDVLGPDVMLVSSGDETAFEVRRLLGELGIANQDDAPGVHEFHTTGDVNSFEQLGRELLGPELSAAHQVNLS